jgi:hypothetical protein|uniref:Uncharacterized protein n=1 Tax=Zea mays TaxID=4577 RepID=B4FPQ6_MAIZE|nr:unknown [Zea mays]
MLQEEPERRYLRQLPGRDGSSVEPVPFFQRRNPEAPALGRLHYDCHHNSGRSSASRIATSRGINSHVVHDNNNYVCTCSTQCLSRAVGNENPRLLMAASALLLPFQPLVVSAVHTGLMEASNVIHMYMYLL